MASTNPHGLIACQEFNALMDRIIGATEIVSASRDAALLSVSKLPLVREVLNDMGFTEQAPVRIEGSNAFLVGFRLIKEILGRVEFKLEDRDRASKFRINLREITSTLDVFDSGLAPTSQPSSSFPKPSRDRVSPTPSLSCISNNSYCPSRTSSHSSSHTDLPTVSERPVRSVRRYSAQPEIQCPDFKPTTKTILAIQNLALKKRCYEEDETPEASKPFSVKKMRTKHIVDLGLACQLVRRPHTAWQDVEVTTSRTAASSRDAIYGPNELRRALDFLKTAITERGFLAIQEAWKASDNVFIGIQKEHIIWPTYLAGRKLPALRRFQEACVQFILAAKINTHSSYYFCLFLRSHWTARKELIEAYKLKNSNGGWQLEGDTVDGHWLAILNFGRPVKYGVRFEQGVYPNRAQEWREIILGDLGQNIVILDKAFGHGFFAMLSREAVQMLPKFNPIAVQQAVNGIRQDQNLYLGIQKACAEAERLMHVLESEWAIRTDNLNHLKSLLVSVR